jgi:hypothetical protein
LHCQQGGESFGTKMVLQEGKDFGFVATFDVVNTLLLFKRALLSNHFFVPFGVVNTLIKGEIEEPSSLV